MKTILCSGDSRTWGYDAETAGRHPVEARWPTVLAAGLGEGHLVVPEGLNGRTTMFNDPGAAADRNGARVLPTHQPLDLVVILLGTNDMKRHTGGGRTFEARLGMERLVEIVHTFPYQRVYRVPDILIVAPPCFRVTDDPDGTYLLGHAVEASQGFGTAYDLVADEYGCDVFDANEVCEVTQVDGFHLDAENTRRLGEGLIAPVKAILARR